MFTNQSRKSEQTTPWQHFIRVSLNEAKQNNKIWIWYSQQHAVCHPVNAWFGFSFGLQPPHHILGATMFCCLINSWSDPHAFFLSCLLFIVSLNVHTTKFNFQQRNRHLVNVFGPTISSETVQRLVDWRTVWALHWQTSRGKRSLCGACSVAAIGRELFVFSFIAACLYIFNQINSA